MEKKLSWKKYVFIINLSLLAVVLILGGCSKKGGSSGDSEGELTGEIVVSSFGGTYDEVFTKYIKEPFEEKYPGTKVTLAPYVGLAKLQQGGAAEIDVVQLDDFDLIEAANNGLLDEVKSKDIALWDDLYSQAFLENNEEKVYGIVNVFGSWGLAYNTEKVEKPTSWNNLFDPEVKGKIALLSQWIPDIIMMGETVDASTDDMDATWKQFEKLTPSVVQYYPSFSTPEALFQSNEIVMASWFDGRVYALQASGFPVDFTVPEEGGILIRSGLGIKEDSSKKALAKELINFAMTPEVQLGFAEELYYGPTNSTVELEGEIAEKVVYGSDEVEKLIVPDWINVLLNREEWLTKWIESTSK